MTFSVQESVYECVVNQDCIHHLIQDIATVGQQLQYLVFYKGEVVGVIGGASAVFKPIDRDWETHS